MEIKAYSINIPEGSLIHQEHKKIDYYDAFAVKVPSNLESPPEELIKLLLQSFPVWGKVLLKIREKIALLMGLKTARGIDVKSQILTFTGQPGESLALFHVKDRTDTEILTGENDKHLDFSLSIMGQPSHQGFEITLATTVIFNNWLGRLYFFPVKPVHKLLVPTMLERMAKKLSEKNKEP